MKRKQEVKPKDVAATQKNLKNIIETPKQRAIQPQKEVEELEQDADKLEKFAKMVEQPDEQLMDPKQSATVNLICSKVHGAKRISRRV